MWIRLILLLVCVLFLSPSGSTKKPSYLYETPAIHTLATEIEPKIYAAIQTYVEAVYPEDDDDEEEEENDEQGHRLVVMRRYMRDYESSSINVIRNESSLDALSSAIQFVSNPLLVHKLINRLATYFPPIVASFDKFTENEDEVEFLKSLPDEDSLPYPTVEDDVNNSLKSLLRIQRYNNFDAKDMVEGRLGAFDTGIKLNAHEAFDMGFSARGYTPQDFAVSIEWLEIALEKLDTDEDEDEDEDFRDMVEEELEEAVMEHDKQCSSPFWKPDMETCFTFLVKSRYYHNASAGIPKKRAKAWVLNQKRSALYHNITDYSAHTRRNFVSTCSGNSLLTEGERSNLKCWYEHQKNLYLTIAPLKFEKLSSSPEIFQIYGILGPKTMQRFKQYAAPTMARSRVVNVKDEKKNDVSEVRTSIQTWLYEDVGDDKNKTDFLLSVSRQIEYATGLNVRVIPLGKGGRGGGDASEAYQVASYRTSHHYDEHMDALADTRRTGGNGDRVGTFMFYLSDVEVGGGTGFPVAGVAARPIAGSAAFWHNLKKNGDPDYRTWHGGCPVAFGVKWVVNKWILYNQNFDKRLCSLNCEE